VRYDEPRANAFYKQLTERARALPVVTSVALTSSFHMDPISVENTSVAPEGFQFPSGVEHVRVFASRIDEGFFDTAAIRLVQGRGVRSSDTRGTPRVAVVNQTFAAHYWPGQNPIGKRFRVQDGEAAWIEIIGVAANVKYRTLTEGATEFIYYPRLQEPATNRGSLPLSTLLVATRGDAALLAAPLREAVRALDANVPTFGVRTIENFYAANVVSAGNLLIRLVGGMGMAGLVMAMIGLYGLVAYSVSRRTREIGIRLAIGAHPRAVLWMVLRQGLVLAGCGSALGLLGSAAAAGLLRAQFPTAGSVAMSTYVMVVPAVLLVTLVSAYIPARRAARIDPINTLRTE
jgi:predicted permease